MTTSALLAYHRIEAPGPAAGESKIQECKKKADGEVAFTENRKEAVRKMFDEIGRGHFAGQDKSRRPREQAKDQERAADQFEHAGDAKRRKPLQILEHLDGRPTEQFCQSVLKQDQAVDDPQNAEDAGRPNGAGFHGAISGQSARERASYSPEQAPRLGRGPKAALKCAVFDPSSNHYLRLIRASALHGPPPANVK